MQKNTFLILLAGIFLPCYFTFASPAITEDNNSEDKVRKIVAKVNGKAIYEDQLTPSCRKSIKEIQEARNVPTAS